MANFEIANSSSGALSSTPLSSLCCSKEGVLALIIIAAKDIAISSNRDSGAVFVCSPGIVMSLHPGIKASKSWS